MRAALAGEWLKLRTVRAPWVLLAVAALSVAGGVTGLAVSTDDLTGQLPAAVEHAGLAAIFSLVLGVLAVAGEYRHRTISDTYLSAPRRGTPLVAKLVVTAAAGAAIGAVAVAVGVGVARVWWLAESAPFAWSDELTRVVVGGIAWNAAFAALGVGVGALVRNVVGAVASALAWIILVETVVGQLLGDEAARWLPMAAGQALGRVPALTDDPLSQTVAAVVLLGYAGLAAVAAGFATLTRDVT